MDATVLPDTSSGSCCNFVIQTGQAATICCSEGDEGYVYEGAKGKIAELTKSYAEKPKFFVDLLACGVSTIATAFYLKAVVVRMSDFSQTSMLTSLGVLSLNPKQKIP